jgi:HK97 gp10 family phage protein
MSVVASGGSVRVELNAAEWSAAFERAVDQIKVRTERQLTRVGFKMQSNARRACPVDTGRLRASIAFEVGWQGASLVLKLGTNVTYAAYVEFGTRFMAPQPYLRPAFLSVRGMIGA